MIWEWLGRLVLQIGRLVLPGVAPSRSIKPSGRCIACGNKGLDIKFVRLTVKTQQDPRPFVVCTCHTCGCSYGLDPLAVAQHPVN